MFRSIQRLWEADPMKRFCGLGLSCVLCTAAFVPANLRLDPLPMEGTERLSASEQDRPVGSQDGRRIAEIALQNAQGKQVTLTELLDRKTLVVIFIGTECPVNNAYMRSLRDLHEEFATDDSRFVAINSNSHDSLERIAEHAKEHRLPFPVLRDTEHRLADALEAERTPEAFVLDAKWAVRYRGRIDDQFGVGFQRPKPTRRDLALALRELLDGMPVSTARTPVAG